MNALKIAKIHNFDRYISFYSNLSLEEAGELEKRVDYETLVTTEFSE